MLWALSQHDVKDAKALLHTAAAFGNVAPEALSPLLMESEEPNMSGKPLALLSTLGGAGLCPVASWAHRARLAEVGWSAEVAAKQWLLLHIPGD